MAAGFDITYGVGVVGRAPLNPTAGFLRPDSLWRTSAITRTVAAVSGGVVHKEITLHVALRDTETISVPLRDTFTVDSPIIDRLTVQVPTYE